MKIVAIVRSVLKNTCDEMTFQIRDNELSEWSARCPVSWAVGSLFVRSAAREEPRPVRISVYRWFRRCDFRSGAGNFAELLFRRLRRLEVIPTRSGSTPTMVLRASWNVSG